MSTDGIRIREYRGGDFLTILEMESSRGGDPYCHAVFIRQMSVLFPGIFLIAENQEGEIIGYTIGGLNAGEPKSGLILRIFVLPESRRCGTGRILMRELTEIFRKYGADYMLLTVSPSNEVALNMYNNIGFSKSESISDYFGKGEDRIVMNAHLHRVR